MPVHRSGRARRALAGAILVSSLIWISQERPRSQTPTFRGGASYVRVDMYPSRADGIVSDLRQDEVELLEDGVPQKIEQFELVKIPPGGPEAARIEPNSIRASQQAAADPRARVFVIFFDTLHVDVQTPERVRTPLRRFLDEALGPDDLVAMMAPKMSASSLTFTRRTTVLSSLLEQIGFTSWKVQRWDDLDPTEEFYRMCYPDPQDPTAVELIARRREKLTFDALEDLVVRLGEIREERKTVFVITAGWRLFTPNSTLIERHSPKAADTPIGDRLRGGRGSTGSDVVSSTTVDQCSRDLLMLAQLDHSNRLRGLSEMANRRNVSFYPIAPGLSAAPSVALANLPRVTTYQNISESQRQGELRGMAEDTDGVAIVNTNIVDEPMRRIIADTSTYYLLGYQSTNSALDGKYRKITVRVKRPGVQVRARQGYRALSAAEMRTLAPTAPAPTRTPDPVARALNRLGSTSARAPVLTRAAAWSGDASGADGSAAVWIVGEVGAELRSNPAWRTGVRARLTLLGADATTAGSAVAELSGTPPAFSIRLPEGGRVKPGTYSLRIGLSNSASETITDSTQITIAPNATPLGEPLLFRRGLPTTAPTIPTADSQFRRSERLHVELPTSAQTAASARVLDASGKPLTIPAAVSTRADASGGFTWVVVELALSPFAPGDYALEIKQGEDTQVAAFRVVN